MSSEAKKKKILVIEDEDSLLMAIKAKLELEGYEVLSADNGEEGEKLLKKEHPDLLLLDILLPKRDGFEVMRDLVKEGVKLPIIIISNSGQPVEIERAKKLGAVDYLVKADFSPSEVVEKVKKIIKPNVVESEEKNANVSQPGSQKIKVLIIEDDEFLRGVISQKLEKEGFETEAVVDAREAFESFKTKKPHIILLDLILPGMDGYEFLSRIKKNPDLSAIPVIVLSNLGEGEDIDRARNLGAADYLVKANFTPSEIVEKLRKALRKGYL
jgi:DNA-binding response OmpR family regulator